MAKSTCLAVLSALTDSGSLVQHPTRRDYRLGPSVVAVGRAALARFPDLQQAHAVLAETSAVVRMPISVSTVADEQIIVLEVIGGADPSGGYPNFLLRLPFQPPYGFTFAGWAEPDVWERWLSRASEPIPLEHIERLREELGEARRARILRVARNSSGPSVERAEGSDAGTLTYPRRECVSGPSTSPVDRTSRPHRSRRPTPPVRRELADGTGVASTSPRATHAHVKRIRASDDRPPDQPRRRDAHPSRPGYSSALRLAVVPGSARVERTSAAASGAR